MTCNRNRTASGSERGRVTSELSPMSPAPACYRSRFCSSASEVEADAELQLPRVGGRGEAERPGRRGVAVAARARRGERAQLVDGEAADDVVDAREVRPVEEVEALERQLKELVLAEVEAA